MVELESLGAILRTARESHHLTQDQVGDACYVSGTTVGDWEKDDTKPPATHWPTLVRLMPTLTEEAIAEAAARTIRRRAQVKIDKILAKADREIATLLAPYEQRRAAAVQPPRPRSRPRSRQAQNGPS
jgi:transcriptional regulator with XRE-family HTH domain